MAGAVCIGCEMNVVSQGKHFFAEEEEKKKVHHLSSSSFPLRERKEGFDAVFLLREV